MIHLKEAPQAFCDERDLARMRLPQSVSSIRLAQLKGSPCYETLASYLANLPAMASRHRGMCFVGPIVSSPLKPAAVLLRAYGLYGASVLYVHTDELRQAAIAARTSGGSTRLIDQARTCDVVLFDELPTSSSTFADHILSMIRRRRAQGQITLATLSVMAALIDAPLRDTYQDAMILASMAPSKVWIEVEIPEKHRVYPSPTSAQAHPAHVLPGQVLTPPQAGSDLETTPPTSPPPPAPARSPEPVARRVDREDRAR
jgi:DNA replication protein DnaC